MYLLQIYVGFNALSATQGLGIQAAFSVLSLATLAMIVAPGGLGAFPVAFSRCWSFIKLITSLLAGLCGGTTTGIVIIAGFISFGLLINNNKKKMKQGNKIVDRILSNEQLKPQLHRWNLLSKTIAFTNGVFDILHEGHIKVLTEAALLRIFLL